MKTKFLIPLIAGAGLLCACKSNYSKEAADTASNPTVKTERKISDSQPKIVKTADMTLQVQNVQQTAGQITTLAVSYNGAVIHHLMRSVQGDSLDIRKNADSILRVTTISSTAQMTVKIPPVNMEAFMNQVARLGIYVKDQRMDITDKTLDYLSTNLKLKNQDNYANQQQTAGAGKKTPDDMLAFKNRMVDQQINNRKIDDSVKNSIVVLSFYADNVISKRVIANDKLSAYGPPLSGRLGISFAYGWEAFTEVLAFLINFWVLAPVGTGAWLIVKYYRNRKSIGPAKS